MCNLSWTPHSNLEKDNSLKTTPVLAQRWAVWSILTKIILVSAMHGVLIISGRRKFPPGATVAGDFFHIFGIHIF